MQICFIGRMLASQAGEGGRLPLLLISVPYGNRFFSKMQENKPHLHQQCKSFKVLSIDYLPVPDTYHGWPDAWLRFLPILCPVCHSCSKDRWKYRLLAGIFPHTSIYFGSINLIRSSIIIFIQSS